MLAKYLPKTKFFSKVALVSALPLGDSRKIKTSSGMVVNESLVGMKGVANSFLRPSGSGKFDGKSYNVISNGDFIEQGSDIVIVDVQDNNHIVVEKEEEK